MKIIKIFVASTSETKDALTKFKNYVPGLNSVLEKKEIKFETTDIKDVEISNVKDGFLDVYVSHRDDFLYRFFEKELHKFDFLFVFFDKSIDDRTYSLFKLLFQGAKQHGKPQMRAYFKNSSVSTGVIKPLEFKKIFEEQNQYTETYESIEVSLNRFTEEMKKLYYNPENFAEEALQQEMDNIRKELRYRFAYLRELFNENKYGYLMEACFDGITAFNPKFDNKDIDSLLLAGEWPKNMYDLARWELQRLKNIIKDSTLSTSSRSYEGLDAIRKLTGHFYIR